MRFFYTSFMYLLTPFLLLRLWWKSKSLPAYRNRISERFYLGKRDYQAIDVWLHAVSLGEVIAASPLIEAMLDKKWSLLITTMTPTGSEQVKMRFGDKVAHQYVPYDLPIILKKFFRQVKPKVGLIMETEIWPNLIYQAKKANIPLLLANARISESSFTGYLKLKRFFKPILNQFTAILPQTIEDAERYIILGADRDLVQVLGNMKFDVQTSRLDNNKFKELKQLWGAQRVVVIVASTHDDEEQQILAQLKRLQKAIPNVLLLIAPRHPERFQTVYQLTRNAGFNTGLRSATETLTKDAEVIVLDSLGELLGFYEISDYAFVGGSLVPLGGHNVLEPIAMGVPVFSGRHVKNFQAICKNLEGSQAIELVHHADELIDAIVRIHQDKEARQKMLQNATAVLESNKGSVLKHLQTVEYAMEGIKRAP